MYDTCVYSKYAADSYDYTSWWVMSKSRWPNGTRPFFDIWRWGDENAQPAFGEHRRDNGPTGFLVS